MAASVLIADDDPNILRALTFLMQREGHVVRTATDGRQALDAVEEQTPDLVLLDLMMPRANGYDVCRALRSSPQHEGVRIIMLTAKGRNAEQQAGLALGADAYITKPFAVSDVTECVARVLSQPAAASRSQSRHGKEA